MNELKCPKCSGEMERGFVASRSLDYTKPDDLGRRRSRDVPHFRHQSAQQRAFPALRLPLRHLRLP